MIYLTDTIAATTADILANTRLSSIPYVGNITIQCLAGLNSLANHYDITIQLPDGKVPVDSQRVSANDSGVEGVLDNRMLDQFTFPAIFGGHFTINFTETGAATLAWRVVLRP